MTQDVVSFVLRFVREAGEGQETRWRGVVKHVQSNAESHFTQFAEAVEFMQSYVHQTVPPTEPAGAPENNPFWETARLWGEFMPQYTKLMMDTVKEVMGTPFAGANLLPQMEKAMAATWAAWGMPAPDDQEKTAEQLRALLVQVATLQAKIHELEAQITQLKSETK